MNVPHSVEKISYQGEEVRSWTGIGKDQAGEPIELAGHLDMHIQVLGDLGGGRMVMQGSNVTKPGDTDWAYLTDGQGFPIQFMTTDIIKRANTVPRWVRPKAEGGDGNTDVAVLIAMRRG